MNNLLDVMDGKKSQKGTTPCIQIASLLFKAVTDAHITHLIQDDKTLARHNAMSIMYEALPGLIDTLVEISMGLYPGTTDIEVEASCKISNPLSYVKDLYNQVDTLRKPIKETFIQSHIDIIQEELVHAMYRLQYIQS